MDHYSNTGFGFVAGVLHGVARGRVIVLTMVLALGVSVMSVAAPGAVAAASVMAVSAPDEEVTAVAGTLGGLPSAGDPAERIDGLEPATLPTGTGSVEVDARWDAVSRLPVEVREGDDLPDEVETVEVSLTPGDEVDSAADATGSLLLSVAAQPAVPAEPTPSPTTEPSEPTTEPTTEPSESATEPATEPSESATDLAEVETKQPSPSVEPTDEPTDEPTGGQTDEPGVELPDESVAGVEVRLDYSDFSEAFGGGWSQRLVVTAFPGCFAETPEVAECSAGVPVEVKNNEAKQTLTFSTSDGAAMAELAAAPSEQQGSEPNAEPDAGSDAEPDAGSGVQQSLSSRMTVTRAAATVAAAPESGDAPGSVVFRVGAGAGSYAAAPVSPSLAWQVGTGSGEFSYDYPFVLPSVMGVAPPSLGLSYSSGSVDAMTTVENGQSSQLGVGWDMSTGYISRSFASCKDDDEAGKGDWCWKSRSGWSAAGVPQLVEDYRIVLGGRSSRLVRIGSSNRFRLEDDPGWRVTLVRGERSEDEGIENADNDDEAFTVESPDGTTYSFGVRGASKSVLTAPVFGNNAGEPCHDPDSAKGSWCRQAWRWSLDTVVDSLGNKTIYTYKREKNRYGLWGDPTDKVEYDRAGYLDQIFWGLRAGEGVDAARANLRAYSGGRCNVDLTAPNSDDQTGGCFRVGNTPWEKPSLWPDVPTDLICRAGDDACGSISPSFFTIHRYARIATQTIDGAGGRRAVDRYDLSYQMPDPDGAGEDGGPDAPDLWLDKVERVGMSGDGDEVGLPSVDFDGVVLRNRVVTGAAGRKLSKFRIDAIRGETGGLVQVRYGHAEGRACDADYVAGRDRWTSTRECFAQRWAPADADLAAGEDPPWTWFHKYVVTRVALGDEAVGYRLDGDQVTKGSPTVLGGMRVYDYDYSGTPAWRFADTPMLATADESWTDWRGYETTTVHTRKTTDRETIRAGDVSQRRTVRFRGMNGSLLRPGSTSRWESFVDLPGQDDDQPDERWLQGRTAEERLYEPGDDGADSTLLSRSVNHYDWFTTANADTNANADGVRRTRMTWLDRTRTITYPVAGGQNALTRSTRYTVHPGGPDHQGVKAGAVTSATTYATDAATTCAATTWLAADNSWLRVPREQSLHAGTCDQTRVGHATTYYDTTPDAVVAGLPTRVVADTGPAGDVAQVETRTRYDQWGRVVKTFDARDQVTTTTYEPADDLTTTVTTTNPLGHTTTTRVEPWRGQPVETIDPNGRVTGASTRMSYDALGRLVTVRKPGNTASEPATVAFDYDVSPTRPSRVTTRTQRQGDTVDQSRDFLDGWGRQIATLVRSVDDSEGDDGFWVGAVTGYDEQGLTRFTMPEALTRDPSTAPNVVLDDDAPRFTRLAYDAAGRTTSSRDIYAGATVASTTWTHRGDATLTRPPAGGDTLSRLNGLGQTTAVEQYAGPESTTQVISDATYGYTPAGQMATITATHQDDAAPSTWRYSYDWLGQRQATSDPDTGTTESDYDPAGNLVASRTPSARGTVTVSTTYDALGRPVQRRDTAGKVVGSWTYDTGANGTPVANAVGRAVSSTSHTASGEYSTEVTGYEPDGDPKGTRTSWPAVWTGGPAAATASSTVTYGYNDASQVTTTRYGGVYGMGARTISHRYTDNGLLEQITADGGVTLGQASYNRRNLPIGLDSFAPGAPVDVPSMGRGFEWQPATGYLDVLTAAVDTGDTLRLGYGYDAGGNITTIRGRSGLPATATDPTPSISGSWCYTYDPLNRLATARTGSLQSTDPGTPAGQGCGDNGGNTDLLGAKHQLAYTYTRDALATVTDTASGAKATYAYPSTGDPAAGRPVHGAATITQTGNDPNKVMPQPGAKDGRIAMSYDPAGRIIQMTPGASTGSKGVSSWYTYDDQGNPVTQVTGTSSTPTDTRGEATATDSAFDTSGIRVMRRTTAYKNGKPSGAVTTVFLGDTEITFNDATNQRTLTRSYTTPGGTPIAAEEVSTDTNGAAGPTAWTWLVADQQHSVRLAKGPGGVKRTAYLPYGTPLGYGNNPALAPGGRGYLNKTHDPGGDIRLDHRAYQPALNILTTPDPLLDPYDPQSLNPYAYSRNNPITLSDPSGLKPASLTTMQPLPTEDIEPYVDSSAPNSPTTEPPAPADPEPSCSLGCRAQNYLSGAGVAAMEAIPINYAALANGFCGPSCAGNGIESNSDLITETDDFEENITPSSLEYMAGYWLGLPTSGLTAFTPGMLRRLATSNLGKGAANAGARLEIQLGTKVEGQLAKRGWTRESVEDLVNNPSRTVATRDTRHLPGGGRNDAPATGYINRSGGYVVRNDETGDIVQVSNLNDPNWKSPW